jgi:hypothetical protein
MAGVTIVTMLSYAIEDNALVRVYATDSYFHPGACTIKLFTAVIYGLP